MKKKFYKINFNGLGAECFENARELEKILATQKKIVQKTKIKIIATIFCNSILLEKYPAEFLEILENFYEWQKNFSEKIKNKF